MRRKPAGVLIDAVITYASRALICYDDAIHFAAKGDLVNAFAAVNYAHGWLDARAAIDCQRSTSGP